MDPVSWTGLALILILTLLSALLATAENATLELSRTAPNPDTVPARRSDARLAELLSNRFRFWISARTGAAIFIFASAALAATTVSDALARATSNHAWSVVLAIALLAVVHTAVARIGPRILAQRHPAVLARRLSIFAWTQYVAILPMTKLLERLLSTEEQAAWKGPDPKDLAVLQAVEEGTREGSIDQTDVAMITNVIDLGDRVARQVMTPRPDIVAAPVGSSVRETLAMAKEHGLSRLPVYENDLDHVVGIVHVREVMAALLDPETGVDLASLAREPFFIPDVSRVDLLLRRLQARHTHMAIVVNEFGETVGLVTIEDLLEEIVGEIEDEFDMPETPIERVGADEALVDAGALIDDVNAGLDLTLQGEDVDTIGGLVYSEFGRLPSPGETITLDGASIRVTKTDDRSRIVQLRVRRLAPPVDDGS